MWPSAQIVRNPNALLKWVDTDIFTTGNAMKTQRLGQVSEPLEACAAVAYSEAPSDACDSIN
jgi:hypothetical protein